MPAATRTSSHRGRRWVIAVVVLLVVLFASLHTFAVFYTDALWFSSINLHSVWLKLFEVKTGLMIAFSAIFAVLLLVLHSSPAVFRAGWFMESVVSAALIVLVVRTRRPFFKSRPSGYLAVMTLVVVAAAVALPFTPLGGLFGFARLPLKFIAWMAGIVALYVVLAEATKRVFYKRVAILR